MGGGGEKYQIFNLTRALLGLSSYLFYRNRASMSLSALLGVGHINPSNLGSLILILGLNLSRLYLFPEFNAMTHDTTRILDDNTVCLSEYRIVSM